MQFFSNDLAYRFFNIGVMKCGFKRFVYQRLIPAFTSLLLEAFDDLGIKVQSDAHLRPHHAASFALNQHQFSGVNVGLGDRRIIIECF